MIIFIAMILVAGIAASVILETMNSLEEQALLTGRETAQDISSGLKVTHISGYSADSNLVQLALYVRTMAGSDALDLNYAHMTLSDTSSQVILNYSTSFFSSTVSNGIFGTLDSANITATMYGIMVIRDIDSSCSATAPVINDDDLVVLLVNATNSFSGIGTRKTVTGRIVPEFGINGFISFTTPSVYIDTIVEL